jgi:hypothetical protein
VGALIDSSVLIAVERGKLDLERVLRDHGDEPDKPLLPMALRAAADPQVVGQSGKPASIPGQP